MKDIEEVRTASKLLWLGREWAEMYYDVVKRETGKSDQGLLDYIAAVDKYRAAKGWSDCGFGGEEPSKPLEDQKNG